MVYSYSSAPLFMYNLNHIVIEHNSVATHVIMSPLPNNENRYLLDKFESGSEFPSKICSFRGRGV